jgi:hypothetical protein
MGFIRLDEMTDEHPKVLAAIDVAGEAAAWLWVRSICYAARAYTDGFVPKGKVIELARAKDVKRKTSALLSAGLWEEADGGYTVHDFLEHNVSAADRKASRQRNADRVAKHRARNGDVTALQARSSNADVTPEYERSNPPIEVEVEVEELRTPLPPLQGGRQRDKDARRKWVRSLAEQFPNLGTRDHAEGLIWRAVSAGAETVEDVRAYVQGQAA